MFTLMGFLFIFITRAVKQYIHQCVSVCISFGVFEVV